MFNGKLKEKIKDLEYRLSRIENRSHVYESDIIQEHFNLIMMIINYLDLDLRQEGAKPAIPAKFVLAKKPAKNGRKANK